MSQRINQEPPVLPSTPPQPSPQLYKDLLIFEERLKQNVRRLKRKKRKYRVQLGALLLAIVCLLWLICFETSPKPWSFLYKFVLVGCSLTFYWIYRSRKYIQTTKYIPQCNRSLHHFNMSFKPHKDHPEGKLWFSEHIPLAIDEGFQAFKALYFQRKRSLSALRSVRRKDAP